MTGLHEFKADSDKLVLDEDEIKMFAKIAGQLEVLIVVTGE
jgi:hypothetical protein